MNLTFRIQAIATVFFLTISSGMADENKSVPIEVKSMGDYEAMDKAARSGDYQAQRNIAYTLSTSIPNNPILGCAWRMVIVESGAPQVDQSDTANKDFFCGKLSPEDRKAAMKQKEVIQSELSKRP